MSAYHKNDYIHSSELTKGHTCDGCACLEVLVRRRNRREYELHYCNSLRSLIDLDTVICQRGGAVVTRKTE